MVIITGLIGLCISLGFLIFIIISCGKIFTKMGEKWWKIFIPIYNAYIVFKRVWSTNMFIVTFVLGCLYSIAIIGISLAGDSTPMWITIMGSAVGIVTSIIGIILQYKISVAFGHGIGWTLGLIFLSFIFIPMLAFGHSTYVGNHGKTAENKFNF